jgi:hypothetical protein
MLFCIGALMSNPALFKLTKPTGKMGRSWFQIITTFPQLCFSFLCVGAVCVCLAYTSEDFHMKTHRYTEDSTPSEDPKTGPRKTLAKNAKNVMFYHLRGVRAPRTSMDFQPYLIYEDIRVLGSISKASRGVCVYMYVRLCVSPCFEVSSWKLAWE